MHSTMQVLQPQGLFTNKPLCKPLLHKPCFYASPAFTQALLLHKRCFYTSPAFTQTLSLHKRCLYTSTAFTQGLLCPKTFLQKTSFHTNAVFTQALSLHKHCFYTSPALPKNVFTKDLLSHKRCLYTSSVFTQALLLYKPCFDTKIFFSQKPSQTCKRATGWMAGGMPKAVNRIQYILNNMKIHDHDFIDNGCTKCLIQKAVTCLM